MNDITKRFLDVYGYLKNNNLVFSPKAFAYEIGVSTSLITEICKERTNAGIIPVQNVLNRYDIIDAEWLLTGKGSMLKSDLFPVVSELEKSNKELAEARLEIIDGLKHRIATLEQTISELRYTRNEPILYSNVAERAPELIGKKHK